jgi:glycosyltransferase involved in cell wall biosynthesis
MSQLFFIINQDPADGSAHALYCRRLVGWLARTRPDCQVTLVHPEPGRKLLRRHSPASAMPSNLRWTALPAVRRARGRSGITVDLVYHWMAFLYLFRQSRSGDWLVSGSFPRLFHFLLQRPVLRQRLKCLYEVHDLAWLNDGGLTRRAERELIMLARAHGLLTTTQALADVLARLLPERPVQVLPLGCGFEPDAFPTARSPPHPPAESYVLGYVGSLYREQGVQWLVRAWPNVNHRQPLPLRLEVAGGTPREVRQLQSMAEAAGVAEDVAVRGALDPGRLVPWLHGVDALIIPALPEGRMPYVAITKAYDYLGLRRPILASDLPTIREVIRPDREGLLFRAGDAAILACVVRQLALEPARGAALAEAAAKRSRDFSWEDRARHYWRWLDEQRTAPPAPGPAPALGPEPSAPAA